MTTNIDPNLYATFNGAPPRIKVWVANTAKDTYTVSTKAKGSYAFTANPTGGTIVLNGTTWTFVSALTSGNQLLLGASLPLTMVNAAQTLNVSADTQTAEFDYQAGGASINLTAVAVGTAGNALTITTSGANATASGATLAGGSALITAAADFDGPFAKTCAALRALGSYDNSAWVVFQMPLVNGGWSSTEYPITYGMRSSTQYYTGDSEA